MILIYPRWCQIFRGNQPPPSPLDMPLVVASLNSEAAIEGVQASVDDLKLLSGGWSLKIEIVICNSTRKYLIVI